MLDATGERPPVGQSLRVGVLAVHEGELRLRSKLAAALHPRLAGWAAEEGHMRLANLRRRARKKWLRDSAAPTRPVFGAGRTDSESSCNDLPWSSGGRVMPSITSSALGRREVVPGGRVVGLCCVVPPERLLLGLPGRAVGK